MCIQDKVCYVLYRTLLIAAGLIIAVVIAITVVTCNPWSGPAPYYQTLSDETGQVDEAVFVADGQSLVVALTSAP